MYGVLLYVLRPDEAKIDSLIILFAPCTVNVHVNQI